MFLFLAWEEFPTSEVVLVYPIQEAQFPSVTLCPENSNPDRWGPVIKIFDNLKRTCLSERYEREGWFCDLDLILILTWSQKIKKSWSPDLLISTFFKSRKPDLQILISWSSLVAVKTSWILKAKQTLGVTFNFDKQDVIDFMKFSKMTMCRASEANS